MGNLFSSNDNGIFDDDYDTSDNSSTDNNECEIMDKNDKNFIDGDDNRQNVNDDENTNYSLLSNKAIVKYINNGLITVYPFVPENLSTSSYDVTLGEYYFRENRLDDDTNKNPIYNIYSESMVRKVWGGPIRAIKHKSWIKKTKNPPLENIHLHERIIFIHPGETILAHTIEFIGGNSSVTTMMKARSRYCKFLHRSVISSFM